MGVIKWIWHKDGYYYAFMGGVHRTGLRADKNFNVYGGDPITLAVVAIGAGAAAYGGAQQKSAAENAQQQAIEAEERARERAGESTARIEAATRLTPEEQAREKETFALEEERRTELQRRESLAGEELLKEVGPQTAALLKQIEERAGLTGEELFRREGEIPSALQEQVLAGARAPGGTFEDTLKQQLEISRQQISAEANRRGVFGGAPEGGIRFEQLGRAGVDLAISSAREREAARQQDLVNASSLATQFLNLSATARGETAAVGEAGQREQEQARLELANFLQNTQQLTESARGRQAEGVVAGQQLDIERTEPAATRRLQTGLDVAGIQAGQGARLQEAGLGLAGIGVGGLIGGIPAGAKTADTGFVSLAGTRESEEQFEDLFRLQQRAGRLP